MANMKRDKFFTSDLKLTSDRRSAAKFALVDQGNGKGHSIVEEQSKKHVSVDKNGEISLKDGDGTMFKTFSVTL